MKTIVVTFKPLHEITLDDIWGTVGTYVLWSKKDKEKPGYIGQGLLLQRFSNHLTRTSVLFDRLPWPIKGLFAILGEETNDNLNDAKIIESTLLWVAEETKRWPRLNNSLRISGKIKQAIKKHKTLKIIVKGFDPLARPYTPIRRTKTLVLSKKGGDIIVKRLPWKVRQV